MERKTDELVALLERGGLSAVVANPDGVVLATVGAAADGLVSQGEPLPASLHALPLAGLLVAPVGHEGSADELTLLSSLGHELRAPLNAILGMSELLASSRLDSAQRRQLDLLRRAATGLNDLLDRLLQLERLGRGDEHAAEDPFHLYDVLESVLDLFSVKAQRHSTELGAVVDEGVANYLVGDASRLRQVLVNLLDNAVKLTHDGSIVVRVINEAADVLRFSVEDSGPGVSEERRSRLFSPFWQPARPAGEGGVGLGLAISLRLVELMGGRLWHESVDGGGARFCFTARAREQEHPDRVTRPSLARAASQDVILLDDSAVGVEAASAVLRRHGLRPRVAASIDDVQHALAAEPAREWTVLASVELVRGREEALVAALARARSPARLLLQLPSAAAADEIELAARLGAVALFRPLQRRALLEALRGEPRAPSPPRSTTPARVLVCDDAEDSRLFALTVLSAEGHHVDAVGSGKEALARLATGGVDVAFINLEMPGLSGLDVVRSLPGDRRASVRLVACTARAEEAVDDQLTDAGFDSCLAKPVSRAALLRAVEIAAPADAPSLDPIVEARTALLRRDFEAIGLLADRMPASGGVTRLAVAAKARDTGAVEAALSALESPQDGGERARDSVQARLAALVPRFLAQRADDLAAVRRALSEGDLQHIRFIGHRIAGSSTTYGFPELGRVGREIEESAEEEDIQRLEAGVEALAEVLERAGEPGSGEA